MIKALIIDDEKNSREILEFQLTKHCPDVKILASVGSPLEAIEMIHKLNPQLVFLDIQMPEMNGFELLERMNPIGFEVIFTTAFNEHAVKAFKYNALDYLLKPIDVVELKGAIDKVKAKVNSRPVVTEVPAPMPKRMALTNSNSLVFVEPENIIYCQGESNYTSFHMTTTDRPFLVTRTLREIEEILTPYDFFRLHHSHLINMKHVREYVRGAGGYVLMSNNHHLTLARTRRDSFLESFKRL